MSKITWKQHPFRLLFYLELILLGIALLATFSPLMPFASHLRHSPRFPGFWRPFIIPYLGLRLRPLVLLIIAAIACMGIRLPFDSRLVQGLYTSLGFSLSWLAVLLGGKVERVFPALLLVVVIRACLLFPWSGRIVVAILAYISYISLVLVSLWNIRPLGIPLGRRIPPRWQQMPEEFWQGIAINYTLTSALFFGLVLIFVLLLVGAVLAEYESRQELTLANRRLRQYALLIEDQATLQERNRIAREMHDSVGHSLTAQSIQLENTAVFLEQDLAQARQHLHKAQQLGKEALQNVRHSVATLRNHPLKSKSLANALTELLDEFEGNNGIKIEPKISIQYNLSKEVATALYRVTQEALTNIAKHSGASLVKIKLIAKLEDISLSIVDNGQGFNPKINTTGFGLQSMRERIESVGGKLILHSKTGQGCRIEVKIFR